MSTDRSFVDYIVEQADLGRALSFRKMFGEYALYLNEKVVAFICDNQLFVKPTAAGRELLGTVAEHPPYPGAKLYFRIDEAIDDPERLSQLLVVTAQSLPMPKPKVKSPAKGPVSPKSKRR